MSVDENIALAERLLREWRHTNPAEPGAAGANAAQALGFNSRLQITSNTFTNVHLGSNSNATIAKTYDYYDDGRTAHAYNGNDNRFDRAYTYDHAGRIVDALTGSEARGGTTADGPFKQQYSYDVWTNTTSRTGRIWTQSNNESASFTNNRHQYWAYDAEGHAMGTIGDAYGYDVTAKPTSYAAGWVGDYRALEAATSYDGSGTSAKQIQTTREGTYNENNELEISTDVSTTYYLRSTALGGKLVAEINAQGVNTLGHVYAGPMEIAQTTGGATWVHTDPLTGSSFNTSNDRSFYNQKEIDPLGTNVTTAPPPHALPVFFQPTLPVEYTGGPSGEFGIPDWYVNMAMASWDTNQASNMHSIGRDDLAQEILAKNPNVGLSVTISGWGKPTVFGEAAAAYLGRIRAWIDAGILHEVGEHGEVVGYEIDDPQNPDKAISAAVDRARTILSTKNPCSDYFGVNATKALNTFEKILTRGYPPAGPGDKKLGIIQYGRQTTYESPTQYRTYQYAVINSDGPFFNRFSQTRIGGYDPGRNQSQVLQILHELAHLVYSGGHELIPDDAGPTKKVESEDNTREILKHCKSEIDKIKN